MLEVLGKTYYIDVDKVIEQCRPVYYPPKKVVKKKKDPEAPDESEVPEGGLELNVFKFEVFKACIEKVLNEYEEVDDKLGAFASDSTTLSFRIAFNTLIKYKILIESENE